MLTGGDVFVLFFKINRTGWTFAGANAQILLHTHRRRSRAVGNMHCQLSESQINPEGANKMQ